MRLLEDLGVEQTSQPAAGTNVSLPSLPVSNHPRRGYSWTVGTVSVSDFSTDGFGVGAEFTGVTAYLNINGIAVAAIPLTPGPPDAITTTSGAWNGLLDLSSPVVIMDTDKVTVSFNVTGENDTAYDTYTSNLSFVVMGTNDKVTS